MGRYYDYDFKQYIARLVVDEGKRAKEVSREMDIPYNTMLCWVSNYRGKKKF